VALLHATQLYSGIVTGSGVTDLYTVPAGNRIILRSAYVESHAAVSIQASLLLNVISTIHIWNLTAEGTAGDSNEWRPWMVLTPGQIIRGKVATVQPCVFIISGSIYTI
jgi:hypothetical protein